MIRKVGKALVVGAGVSGIRAALDLAETGYGVILIDRAAHMGGVLTQLDYQFPTNRCGMCRLLPLVDRDAAGQVCLRKGLFHDNIDVLLNTDITAVEGEAGRFEVSLRERATGVDAALCVGCGKCVDVCPVEVPDPFNEGMSTRKAIYLPVPHNLPNTYLIDMAACTRCGECAKACSAEAVQLDTDRRQGFRILVVDDEPIIRDSLKEWLADERFYVETASSGPEALEKLAGESFNLMLADIKMPGMDGVELLRKAKQTLPGLCVLMMTAYATVDTAVEAMKIGALDYLIKPFDPQTMLPKVISIYEDAERGADRKVTVGAIVLCGGTAYFDPADQKDVFAYGANPNVITSLAFERMLSGTGPGAGKLVRPHDGKSVERIAWLQCVGSRDIQYEADFCSSICCMVSIKEAVLAKDRVGDRLDAAIFYTDMRTFGKTFQRYREYAQREGGVRFVRSGIHSITPQARSGDAMVRYVRTDGTVVEEAFDLIVLAVGQRPTAGTASMAELHGLKLNPWGYVQCTPFSPTATSSPGIMAGGAFSGLKDIGEAVIHASAASLEASRIIHTAGGSLAVETPDSPRYRDVSMEIPRILVAVCTCAGRFGGPEGTEALVQTLEKDPHVERVAILDAVCTADGWGQLVEIAETCMPNRLLMGACLPHLHIRKLRELGERIQLDAALMDVVDIRTPMSAEENEREGLNRRMAVLGMGLSRLTYLHPATTPAIPVVRKALVVGGGIAGMYAALGIADHGYRVDLVERGDTLGGNLHWLQRTIDGESIRSLMETTVQRVETHPHIHVHLQTTITGAFGEVGRFFTTLSDHEEMQTTLEHGAVILATGGREAAARSHGYGTHGGIITQSELERRLGATESDQSRSDQSGESGRFDPERLHSVVMIQCVDSREEPRNYCSRVCCPTSLKHALALKQKNPQMRIYVFYRDIMTPGFAEQYYTEARRAGVIFIRYDAQEKPRVSTPEGADGPIRITAVDPLLGRTLEIEADLLVLATGVVPELPEPLAAAFGAQRDLDGFFDEAESKWRPVDALKEGVFACGLVLSPQSIPGAMASAAAAAQRCLRILSHATLPVARVVARVRHSLCSRCQRCISSCPFTARSMDADGEKVLINTAMCQGCGDCAAVCPNGAAVVAGFGEKQLLDTIDTALYGL